MHHACDISNTDNLRQKLHTIPATLSRIIAGTSPKLNLVKFSELKNGGLCNKLLHTCCSGTIGDRLPKIGERHDNTTDAFQRDLFSLMTPLFRVCVARTLGVSPYSTAVNEKLRQLFPPRCMALLLDGMENPAELSRVIEEGLDNIATAAFNQFSAQIADEFSHLRFTGLFDIEHQPSPLAGNRETHIRDQGGRVKNIA
jgi:hypothetical protein